MGVGSDEIPGLRYPRIAQLARIEGTVVVDCTIQLTVYPPAYYLTQNFPRYRYPILWVSPLLAAYWISLLLTCGKSIDNNNRNEIITPITLNKNATLSRPTRPPDMLFL